MRTDRFGPSGTTFPGEEIQEYLSENVRSDLASIKHVAVPRESWTTYSRRYQGPWNEHPLRNLVAKLGNVEHVSLIVQPDDEMEGPYVGYTKLIHPFWGRSQEELELRQGDDFRLNNRWAEDENCKYLMQLLRRRQSETDADPTPEEEKRVPPEAKLVEMEFVPNDGPLRLREKDW